MLRPGGVARPALARAFTTKLSWTGSPLEPMLVMTEWFIVIYHCRIFTGRTGSLMGCEQRREDTQRKKVGCLAEEPKIIEPLMLLNAYFQNFLHEETERTEEAMGAGTFRRENGWREIQRRGQPELSKRN